MTTTANDIPILFSGPMVLAHLAGRKSMTRRLLSPRYVRFFDGERPSYQPTKALLAAALIEVTGLRRIESDTWVWQAKAFPHQNAQQTNWLAHINPVPGTRMWVRERTTVLAARDGEIKVSYDADSHAPDVWFPFPDRMKQKPITGQRLSMGCYREVSRITDTVTAVKVERAHEISEADAIAEGCGLYVSGHGFITEEELRTDPGFSNFLSAKTGFEATWMALHGPASWAANPYAIAIGYSVIKANIDAPEARAA